jgi:multidrug efflux pump subunit AcrA (membrane-fusion protein)
MGEETMAHTIEFRWVVLGLLLGFAWLVAGCAPDHPVPVAAPPASVTVSYPVEREVIDHVDFTARTAAVDSVEVRARVWGYLDKVNFKEGALVKKGEVLFEIDPRSYQAAVDQVQALIVQAEAQLRFKESQFNRLEKLFAKGAIPGKSLNWCNPSAMSPLPPLDPTRRTSGSANSILALPRW